MTERHTLLLADDSATIQRVVALTFANENIDVISVGDGDRAIDSLRHAKPDIVLADVGMPGRSGYDVAKHIKETPGLEHIPVLLLTGAFEPIDQARAAEVKSDGTLIKPFDPESVIRRVRELLSGTPSDVPRTEPAPVAATAPPPPPAAASLPSLPLERPADVARLDDYFDTLDQALSARVQQPPALPPPPRDTVAEVIPTQAAAPPKPVEVSAPQPDSSPEHIEAPAHGGEDPLLAGAFSALLAAEQSGAAPDAFLEWLPEAPPPAPAEASKDLSADTIDVIVNKVIERLSESVVRDAVTAVASATAERLVREEIERIKSHIK